MIHVLCVWLCRMFQMASTCRDNNGSDTVTTWRKLHFVCDSHGVNNEIFFLGGNFSFKCPNIIMEQQIFVMHLDGNVLPEPDQFLTNYARISAFWTNNQLLVKRKKIIFILFVFVSLVTSCSSSQCTMVTAASLWCWNGQLPSLHPGARQLSSSCDRLLWSHMVFSWGLPGI